ncbi:MAG: hypothetical protein KC931_00550 [Candidatus Omnitrophica bacterium]|nr:hypothetical protein [Candidatus Omnitrophota bacterium]
MESLGGEKIKSFSDWTLPICLVVVVLMGAVTSFFPISESNDDWWHLKAGKLIWEGELGWYSHDPFTESAKDKLWVNHEWLAEWLLYGVTLIGGLSAAILFKSIVLVGTFLLVFFTASGLTARGGFGAPVYLAAFLAVALAIPSSQFTFYIRPPIFTFLFLALYQHFFLKSDGKAPPLKMGIGLAAVMTLWANLHGGAILGCVVVFLMGVGSCLDAFLTNKGTDPSSNRAILGWIYFGIGVAIASLINPYGWHLHFLTFEMMSQKWLTERIAEMLPPRFDFIWTLPLLLIPALCGVLRTGGWGARLVFFFLLWQGVSHVRHLPLLSIWAAPYAAVFFAQKFHRPNRIALISLGVLPAIVWLNSLFPVFPHSLLANGLFRYSVLFVLILLSIGAIVNSKIFRNPFLIASSIAIGYVVVYPGNRPPQFLKALHGISWEGENYPNRLIDLIEEYDIPGEILLNRENYSGYIIWRLVPERVRTFTCSRFDLQGSLPRMELESMLWCAPEPWKDEVSGRTIPSWRDLWDNKYHFDLVILEKYSDRFEPTPFPLWSHLDNPNSGFVRIASETFPGQRFPDQVFSLFVRKGPEIERIMKELKTRPLLRDNPSP